MDEDARRNNAHLWTCLDKITSVGALQNEYRTERCYQKIQNNGDIDQVGLLSIFIGTISIFFFFECSDLVSWFFTKHYGHCSGVFLRLSLPLSSPRTSSPSFSLLLIQHPSISEPQNCKCEFTRHGVKYVSQVNKSDFLYFSIICLMAHNASSVQ